MTLVSHAIVVLPKEVVDRLPPDAKIKMVMPDGSWYYAEPFREKPKQ